MNTAKRVMTAALLVIAGMVMTTASAETDRRFSVTSVTMRDALLRDYGPAGGIENARMPVAVMKQMAQFRDGCEPVETPLWFNIAIAVSQWTESADESEAATRKIMWFYYDPASPPPRGMVEFWHGTSTGYRRHGENDRLNYYWYDRLFRLHAPAASKVIHERIRANCGLITDWAYRIIDQWERANP